MPQERVKRACRVKEAGRGKGASREERERQYPREEGEEKTRRERQDPREKGYVLVEKEEETRGEGLRIETAREGRRDPREKGARRGSQHRARASPRESDHAERRRREREPAWREPVPARKGEESLAQEFEKRALRG